MDIVSPLSFIYYMSFDKYITLTNLRIDSPSHKLLESSTKHKRKTGKKIKFNNQMTESTIQTRNRLYDFTEYIYQRLILVL